MISLPILPSPCAAPPSRRFLPGLALALAAALLLGLTLGPSLDAATQQAPGTRAAPVPALLPEDGTLAARIRRHLAAPRFAAATWGIQVLDLDRGQILFDQDADKYFIPASNAKLFTAAMALQTLGPDLRLRTSLFGSAAPEAGGRLAGNLTLYGRGDPNLMRPWTGGPPQADPLEALARQLQERGVRAIQGDLIGDDSFFAAPPYAPGWEWEDLRYPYGAEPTALTIHHNVLDLWIYPAPAAGRPCFIFAQPGHGLFAFLNHTDTRPSGAASGLQADRAPGETTIRVTGGLPLGAAPVRLTVTLRDSALVAARLLQRTLARHGIQVLGQVRSVHAQDLQPPGAASGVELAHLESPPLAVMVRDMLKDSLNPYAQLLLLQAGARRNPVTGQGDTVRQGLAALAAWMTRAGLAPGDCLLEDGAGGSRKNLVKPAAIVRLLAYMAGQPEAEAFRAALPVAGVDGTLRQRMLGTAAQGNVRAKTGTLRYTHTLSGYVTSAGGAHLAFAIMLNNYRRDPEPARAAGRRPPTAQEDVDAIAELLAQAR